MTPKNQFAFGSAEDPRLSSFLTENSDQAAIHIWGYPDDEGIRLNGGRIGAALGPDQIRTCLYKMTPPLASKKSPLIWDGGNLELKSDLKSRHEKAESQALQSYLNKKFVITLGGGHDYGYPDAAAFVSAFKKSKKKPVVINFDAHLDVRPLDKGLTSGTPFFRLLEESAKDIHFFEVGIQNHCNAKNHLSWAVKHNAVIIEQEKIAQKSLYQCLLPKLAKFKDHPTFLSVDIDGFTSAEAPGCSQSWPVGFTTQDFFKTMKAIFQKLEVKGLGIYEVSPPLDVGNLTSRLAALIVYHSLQNKGVL
jgi:formiminoglutamase